MIIIIIEEISPIWKERKENKRKENKTKQNKTKVSSIVLSIYNDEHKSLFFTTLNSNFYFVQIHPSIMR